MIPFQGDEFAHFWGDTHGIASGSSVGSPDSKLSALREISGEKGWKFHIEQFVQISIRMPRIQQQKHVIQNVLYSSIFTFRAFNVFLFQDLMIFYIPSIGIALEYLQFQQGQPKDNHSASSHQVPSTEWTGAIDLKPWVPGILLMVRSKSGVHQLRLVVYPMTLQVPWFSVIRIDFGWMITLPETNSEFTPENGWLEDSFPFGMACFQGLC